MSLSRRVAIIAPEAKLENMDLPRLVQEFTRLDLEIFVLDLNRPLEEQKPFGAILHNLSDLFAKVKQRDNDAYEKLNKLHIFLKKNPDIVVIEPIVQARKLLDRSFCYSMLRSSCLRNFNVHVPNFAPIRQFNFEYLNERIDRFKVKYPMIVKPMCGSDHRMKVIFDEKHLGDLEKDVPCIIQSFVPHHAVMYKLFVVGSDVCIVQRPSLKLPRPDEDLATLLIDGNRIFKEGNSEPLTIPEEDAQADRPQINYVLCDTIVRKITSLFGLNLIGIELLLEEGTGHYFVLDVNVFPEYDGYNDWQAKMAQYVCANYEVKKY